MAALLPDLVQPDANEALKRVMRGASAATTRSMIEPTDHQPGALVVEVSRVAGAVAGPGHWATVGRCVGQFTRGESACKKPTSVPKSSARQLRRPSPWS